METWGSRGSVERRVTNNKENKQTVACCLPWVGTVWFYTVNQHLHMDTLTTMFTLPVVEIKRNGFLCLPRSKDPGKHIAASIWIRSVFCAQSCLG